MCPGTQQGGSSAGTAIDLGVDEDDASSINEKKVEDEPCRPPLLLQLNLLTASLRDRRS